MNMLEEMIAIARQSALTVLERRARSNGLTITVCGTCSAYLDERPGDGTVRQGACLEHVEVVTEVVQ